MYTLLVPFLTIRLWLHGRGLCFFSQCFSSQILLWGGSIRPTSLFRVVHKHREMPRKRLQKHESCNIKNTLLVGLCVFWDILTKSAYNIRLLYLFFTYLGLILGYIMFYTLFSFIAVWLPTCQETFVDSRIAQIKFYSSKLYNCHYTFNQKASVKSRFSPQAASWWSVIHQSKEKGCPLLQTVLVVWATPYQSTPAIM